MNHVSWLAGAAGVMGVILFSGWLRRSPLSPPFLFMLLGTGLGLFGHGAALNDAAIEMLASITLALILFVDAASLSFGAPPQKRLMRSLTLRLLLIGMPLTILAGTITAKFVFPEAGWAAAALVAIILAPTDAALAQPVYETEKIAPPIRNSLEIESGLNDGIGLPLLVATLVLMQSAGSAGTYAAIGYELIMGPAFGAAAGLAGAFALNRCRMASAIEESWLPLGALCLAGVAYFGAETLHASGLLAVFSAGLIFGHASSPEIKQAMLRFAKAEGQILILATFFLFGAFFLPRLTEWPGLAPFIFALLSLSLLRIAPVYLSLSGTGASPSMRVFMGWFGPRGVASILYLMIAEKTLAGNTDTLPVNMTAAIILAIALSITLHGATAHAGTRLLIAHHRKP